MNTNLNNYKPLALDLCCGLGGWTKGLLAADWDVIGVDIEHFKDYPEQALFFDCNVKKFLQRFKTLEIGFSIVLGRIFPIKFDLVVASPPCQEFSYRSFPFKRCRELAENVPPDKSIWEACERIAKECKAPLVLENVRGAQKYMGKAKAHYGSFYLWGDVPVLLPIGKAKKGFNEINSARGGFGKNHKYVSRKNMSSTKQRKEWSAQSAMIPFELAYWIGECFKNATTGDFVKKENGCQ